MDLDNDFFVGDAALCYKHEQIGHIFHKLLDSIEQCLTWCFKFMQGIWDGIQNSERQMFNQLSRQRVAEGEGGGRSQRMSGKRDEKREVDENVAGVD